MTEADYEREVQNLREGRRLFEEVVVAAYERRLEALERREQAALAEAEAALRREKAQHEPELARLAELKAEVTRRADAAEARLRDVERELAVVRRDRDALVRRAETAEKTLQNHGFCLHTMQRDGGKKAVALPADGLPAAGIVLGRERYADGRGGPPSIETGYKHP